MFTLYHTADERRNDQVENALAVINAHLGKLEKSFMEATEEKTRVEGQARACQERLGLAER